MASFSISEAAPYEETRSRTFKLLGHSSEVTFYPNRIVLAPSGETEVVHDDDDEVDKDATDGYLAARDLCQLVARWDWTGRVVDRAGRTVIEQDDPVPIDPEIVQFIPTRIIRHLNDAIAEDVFPKTRNERRLRNRS